MQGYNNRCKFPVIFPVYYYCLKLVNNKIIKNSRMWQPCKIEMYQAPYELYANVFVLKIRLLYIINDIYNSSMCISFVRVKKSAWCHYYGKACGLKPTDLQEVSFCTDL